MRFLFLMLMHDVLMRRNFVESLFRISPRPNSMAACDTEALSYLHSFHRYIYNTSEIERFTRSHQFNKIFRLYFNWIQHEKNSKKFRTAYKIVKFIILHDIPWNHECCVFVYFYGSPTMVPTHWIYLPSDYGFFHWINRSVTAISIPFFSACLMLIFFFFRSLVLIWFSSALFFCVFAHL